MWGATWSRSGAWSCCWISIHAPRVGSDVLCGAIFAGEAISIHAPRVGSDSKRILIGCFGKISIHAPRVGSDVKRGAVETFKRWISIHAPRVGSDKSEAREALDEWIFQSTLPVWGATAWRGSVCHPADYFNPRSPCGERLVVMYAAYLYRHFNPRSPCGERLEIARSYGWKINFNPRSPCGERQTQQSTVHLTS